jgi:hypothetical protein
MGVLCLVMWCTHHITKHNEMHGSTGKIPSKSLVRQRCAEGFNSGVKGLNKMLEGGHSLWVLWRREKSFANIDENRSMTPLTSGL